ncbi:TPA: hypothetical protein DEB29_02070, partial [Candidatus Wolfebacteria bacterium]|nr:hypothetical protein [Candidatus Wolfebacteria bacterium]
MWRQKDSELFLEESVLDDMTSSLDCMEIPLSKGTFTLVIAMAAIVVAIVSGKVFFLGVNAGTFYKNRAVANVSDVTVRPAERGIFFDRNDTPLVRNIATFRVVLNLSDFLKKPADVQGQELDQLAQIVAINKEDMQSWLANVNLERQSAIVIARELSIEQVAI